MIKNDNELQIMYPNLRAEMARKGIKSKDIASTLEKSTDWVDSRFRGQSSLPVECAFQIKNKHFPGLKFEYLFSTAIILPSEVMEISN